MDEVPSFDFAVIGGGIAGISVIEQISQRLPNSSVLLVTASSYVRVATTKLKLTSRVEELNIEATSLEDFHSKYPNCRVAVAKVEGIYPKLHLIQDTTGQRYGYKKLCVCTGSVPRLLDVNSPNVTGLRDTDSAVGLEHRLSLCRKVCVVGNGGIATELVYELKKVDLVWIIRHKHIANSFVDGGAAEFLMHSLAAGKSDSSGGKPTKTLRYTVTDPRLKSDIPGCALGPNWHDHLELSGVSADKKIIIEYQTEIEKISEAKPVESVSGDDWPVYVKLTNGKVFGCDLVISATGVSPSLPALREGESFEVGKDEGILVNDSMESSVKDVYAAGDVCTVNWNPSLHWFQMRLWTQAKPMGSYAGQCMVASFMGKAAPLVDFSFELFTHVTRFFGFKVVLLGLFNGQKLGGGNGEPYEAIVRVTKDIEYVKLVVRDGKIHGAVLIGDTEMEETIENLILNQLDISSFGEHILDPDIDIDDFFD